MDEYNAVFVDENYVLSNLRKSIKTRRIIAFIVPLICFISVFAISMLIPNGYEPFNGPVHFKGLDYSTRRSDIEKLYGKPDAIREFSYPEGKFYDVYEMEFFGIKGELTFSYFDDGDNLFAAKFIIDSKNFETRGDYEEAVEETLKYFDTALSQYQRWETSAEDGITISWGRTADKYGYLMYNTQMSDTGFGGDYRDCTIFQFNKYLSKDQLD